MTPANTQLLPFVVTWYHPAEVDRGNDWTVLSSNHDFGYEVVCAIKWGGTPDTAVAEVRNHYPRMAVPIHIRSCKQESCNCALRTAVDAESARKSFRFDQRVLDRNVHCRVLVAA